MRRDLAEADRVRSGGVAAHRVLVLVDRPDADGALVDLGAGLAASREHSELILSHLVAHTGGRLEVGAGLGGELVQMTGTMNELQALARKVFHEDDARGLLMTAWQIEHDTWQRGGRSQGLCHLPFLICHAGPGPDRRRPSLVRSADAASRPALPGVALHISGRACLLASRSWM